MKKKQKAKELLQHIFIEVLPKYEMGVRKNQIALSMEMLESIIEHRAALCEAEVGTGKTHAYLIAVLVYKIVYKDQLPAMISTSTIALQKAITEQYLPQLSNILLKEHMIEREISFLIRKGKSHYACENRVKDYYSSIQHNNRIEDKELMFLLRKLYERKVWIDLDELSLMPYVKRKICVTYCTKRCGMFEICRYQILRKKAQGYYYDFQVLNHNIVFANMLRQKSGGKALFPAPSIFIFDEAHQMIHAARQMYLYDLGQEELECLLIGIEKIIWLYPESRRELLVLCKNIEFGIQALLKQWNQMYSSYRKNHVQVEFSIESMRNIKKLINELDRVSVLLFSNDSFKIRSSSKVVYDLEHIQERLFLLLEKDNFIYWLERTGTMKIKVCALPRGLHFLLYEDLWEEKKPYIFTSGILSVQGDFTHFKREIGLSYLEKRRLLEVNKYSPFDYWNQGLLYLPDDLPSPKGKREQYKEAIRERLIDLIAQTHGHTLILFTSYQMMEQMYYAISERCTSYPLFCMGKGRLETLEQFRNSGNGVLFASDSAGGLI